MSERKMNRIEEMTRRLCPEGVKMVRLGEVGTFTRGKRFVRTDFVEDGVPCIHYGDIYTYYELKATKARTFLTAEKAKKMRFAHRNDVIIVGAGENDMDIGVGVAWLGNEDVAVHDACYIFQSELDPIYLSYFLRSTNYHLQLKKFVSKGKICSVSAENIGRTVIPLPPLEVQRAIAEVLDKFSELEAELEAELDCRKRQYEYYRERLLSFEHLPPLNVKK